ncbi:MAG: hypothetical protein ACLUOI_08915 [Eisenbergiella sp.]
MRCSLCSPFDFGNLFRFYNMVDSMIVGQFVENARGGGRTNADNVFVMIAIGGDGTSAITSQYLGA